MRLGEQVHVLLQLFGFFGHAVDGAHEVADAAQGVAHVVGFEHFAGDKLVDGLHRFVGHETGEGAGGVLGFLLGDGIAFAAQGTVQARQVLAFLVVGFHVFFAELLAQLVGDLGDRHRGFFAAVFAYEVGQVEHFAGDDHQQQFLLPGLAGAAGLVQVGAHADDGGEGFGGFALGGVEDPGDVAVAVIRAGVGAVVTAEHIGGQGAYLFAAAAALGGFVLPRVVVEQVVVGGGHQGLQGVGGGGLAGAVAAGEQVHRAVFQFAGGQVAPVDGDGAF